MRESGSSRDLRDPRALGGMLLNFARYRQLKLSEAADLIDIPVVDYDHNPGTLEKYGRPQDLPSTLPN